MRSKNRQLLPASNNSYVQVPGRQGSVLFPRELQDRYIDLDCAFIEKNFPDIRIRAREIAAWLYTEDREILSFNDEPDRYYRGKIASQVDFEHMATMGQFSLTFRCEPLAYGGEQNAYFVNGTAIVNNQGTFEAQPVFHAEFTAATSEWKITDPEGHYIRVVNEFIATDELEVNCITGAILINGVRAMDKLDWQNSRFFPLRVGEGTLTVAPGGVCTARVSWIPRYL
jgi:predicted phage tail component-like protein